MKKAALVIAAVTAILAVVVAAMYFFSPVETIDLGGADSPYPYTCELKHQKLHVHITGDSPVGYGWTAETDTGSALSVKQTKQTAQQADFVLTPKESGIAKVTFVLERSAELPERIFEIDCTFLLGSGGTIESAESTFLELPGLVSGEGEGFSYCIAQMNPYTLRIRVSGDGVWHCERVGVGAEMNGSSQKECVLTDSDGEDGYELLVIAANSEGDGTLYIDSNDGKHIELAYHCTDMGAISLTGHQLGTGGTSVHKDAFEELYGTIGKRLEPLLGEVVQSQGRWCSLADGVTRFPIGVTEFAYDGVLWKLYTSWGAMEADFVGDVTPAGQVAAAEITVNVYEDDSGVRSVWKADSLNYMLESAQTDRTLCEDLTTAILTALFG